MKLICMTSVIFFVTGAIVGSIVEQAALDSATQQIGYLERSHKSSQDLWLDFNDKAMRELCPKDLPDIPRLEGLPIMCGQSMAGQDLKIFTCFKKKVCYVTVDNVGVKELP